MAALGAALFVTACGGGGGSAGDDGGSSPPPTTAGFDATTYAASAEPVAQSVLNASTTGGLPSSLFGVGAGASGGNAVAATLGTSARAAWHGTRAVALRAGALAVETFSDACPGGGSLSGSIDDADNDADLSAGDRVTLDANACALEGIVLDGRVSVRVDAYALDDALTGGSTTMTLTFDGFSAAGVSIDGTAVVTLALSAGAESVTVDYRGATCESAGDSVRLDYKARFSFDAGGAGTSRFDGRVGYGGQTYTLDQREPFVLRASDGLPESGVLQVTETQGARLQIVAGPQRFTYRYFGPSNAGSTPDASTDGATIRSPG